MPASGTIDVPNVVGLPQSEAEAKLKRVGLVVGSVTTANSATTPTGSVSNTNPAGCDLRRDPGWRGHGQWCGW
jgi:beta-lactam-binding protein with PASTA domain